MPSWDGQRAGSTWSRTRVSTTSLVKSLGTATQGGAVEQADEPGEAEEGALLGRDPVGVEGREGRSARSDA